MPTLSKHLAEPYKTPIRYDDYQPLLVFMRRVAPLLAPGFSPPDVATSHGESATGTQVLRRGNKERGFEIETVAISHPHWGFLAVEGVTLRAYGLPNNMALALEARRTYEGVAYLELQAEGPRDALLAVEQAFEREFGLGH